MTSSVPTTAERLERAVPLVVPVVVLAVVILTITPWPVGAFEDDGIYTVLAKALATGEGYRMINLPGAPHATHYPPGYPIVLAALWRVWPEFPDNIVAFKFANALFMAAGSWVALRFARGHLGLPLWGAAIATLAGSVSVLVLFLAGLVLSEPLFIALLFPTLLAAERSADDGNVGAALTAGLLGGALTMVRTLGAPVVMALVAVLLLRRQWRAAVAAAVAAALFVVPWQAWVAAHHHEIAPALTGKYGAYGPWMAEGYRSGGIAFGWDVLLQNAQRMDAMLSYAVMPLTSRWPRLLALIVTIGLLLGGLRLIARRAPVTQLFVVAYVSIILVWPFEPDRFVIGIWPLLVLLGAVGIAAAWRWMPGAWPARTARVLALAALAAVVAGHAAYNWRGYTEQWWVAPQRRAGERTKPLVEWAARHAAKDDVLSTDHDLMVYLYAGRRAIPTGAYPAQAYVRPLSREESTRWTEVLMTTYRPRYFISGWPVALEIADSLAARRPPLLRRVDTLSTALVYERID